MISDPNQPAAVPTRGKAEHGAALRIGLLGLAILAVGIVAILGALSWISDERDRALRDWQARLGIISESRAAAVGDWLQRQGQAVESLATNDSVRLYAGEIQGAGSTQGNYDPAERQYLENFLLAVASREGFLDAARGPEIRANLPRRGLAGMAILGRDFLPLAATPGFPQIDAALRRVIAMAAEQCAVSEGSTTAVLDELQRSIGSSRDLAERWLEANRAEREASARNREDRIGR